MILENLLSPQAGCSSQCIAVQHRQSQWQFELPIVTFGYFHRVLVFVKWSHSVSEYGYISKPEHISNFEAEFTHCFPFIQAKVQRDEEGERSLLFCFQCKGQALRPPMLP